VRRSSTVSAGIWLLLILTAWGGVSPLVLCSGPGDHRAMESLLSTCCEAGGASCVAAAVKPRMRPSAALEPRAERVTARAGSSVLPCDDTRISLGNAPRGPFQRPLSPASVSPKLPLFATPNDEPPRLVWSPVWFCDGPLTPLDLRTTLLI
jgi:hypothetical protein